MKVKTLTNITSENKSQLVQDILAERRKQDAMRQVHKTNVDRVKKEVLQLLNDRKTHTEQELGKKYNYIYEKFPSLFKMTQSTENIPEFLTNLEIILSNLKAVQENKKTQAECTDDTEAFLGEQYFKPKK